MTLEIFVASLNDEQIKFLFEYLAENDEQIKFLFEYLAEADLSEEVFAELFDCVELILLNRDIAA